MDFSKFVIDVSPPEPVNYVTGLEEYFDVELPPLLKRIYAFGDEGHIGPIKTAHDLAFHFDFNAVREPHYEYVGHTVIQAHKSIVKYRPDLTKLVPIGAVGNGDEICLDYRKGTVPSVVLLKHEVLTLSEEPTTLLAQSFEDLIEATSKG